MSDMTIARAREIVAEYADREADDCFSHMLVANAKGYLSGHASRDPEVAELKALLGTDICAIHTRLIEQLAAERETVEKLKKKLDLQQNAIDVLHTTRDELWKSLAVEYKASRKLVALVAKCRCDVVRHTGYGPIRGQCTQPCLACEIDNTLAPTTDATPGHSPEGMVLRPEDTTCKK